MTGWNLPPGCTNADIEAAFGGDGPCDVCGQDVDHCICPECPVCRGVGDPICYDGGFRCDQIGPLDNYRQCHVSFKHMHYRLAAHGLVRTPEQIAAKTEADAALAAEAAEDRW